MSRKQSKFTHRTKQSQKYERNEKFDGTLDGTLMGRSNFAEAYGGKIWVGMSV